MARALQTGKIVIFYSEENGQYRPVTEDQHRRLLRWRISTFWVMLVGYVGYYLCRGNLSAAFPLLEQEFGYSNTQLGLIASLSEIAYAIGKLVNGPLADKVGGRRIFLIGMGGAIFWNLIFSLSASLTAFIIVWCFCRYFLSMGWGGLTKTIGNWYPPERNGTVMGLISVNFQFGGVAATLFAGFLVTQGVAWQGLFVYPALVLAGILLWSILASRADPQDVVPGASFGRSEVGRKQLADYGDETQLDVKTILSTLLGMPIYRQLLLFSFLTTLLRSVFFFWTPKFLFDIGLGASSAILQSAIFPFLGVIGTVFIGWYTDHYADNGDRARTMWIMLLFLVICLLLITLLSSSETPNFPLIMLALGASGFFLLGPYSMSSGCLTLDIAGPKGAGSCTGIIDGLGYIGGAIAAFSAGYLSDFLGWSQVFLILSGFAVISTLSAYLMSREFQRIAANRNEETTYVQPPI
ncbi:MAG: MFS transporter [Gammaproteobacteria bacterium]|nr:MFS transporter [Pseudomonadales bacterium]MCP5345415.1 MFS transporter [Pseudomonadales bacterium]